MPAKKNVEAKGRKGAGRDNLAEDCFEIPLLSVETAEEAVSQNLLIGQGYVKREMRLYDYSRISRLVCNKLSGDEKLRCDILVLHGKGGDGLHKDHNLDVLA